jgi:phospholipase C
MMSACTPNGGSLNPAVSSASLRAASKTPIKHIVIVVQENRSFDNVFAGYPGADAHTYGYLHDGTKVNLKPVYFKSPDLGHSFEDSLISIDHGKMDAFDRTFPKDPKYPYSYLVRKLVAPYWTMAQSYVLADHMFPTEHGASWTSHILLVAGTTKLKPTLALADVPSNPVWGCDAPKGTTSPTIDSMQMIRANGPFPCFSTFKTMADTLDAAHVSWKYYSEPEVGCPLHCTGGFQWDIYDAIKQVRYGADWANVISPETQVLKDIGNGSLASVSWVMPDWKNSDHPFSNSDTGPSWVAAIVNGIGHSQYWNSTAIIIFHDDWGGWFDDLAPPQVDFLGLGIRVPCMIVSPYPKAVGYVSHTQYEFGSILKFTEETFGLNSLNKTDVRANSLSDSFNFSRKPLQFKTIPAKYPASKFLLEPHDAAPPNIDS